MKRILSTLAMTAIAAAMAACANTREPTPLAKFDTPPDWLDRVELAAYTPQLDYDTPRPLGDYETEDPTRWVFRGHPLYYSEDEEGMVEEVPAESEFFIE
jgi:hypothetical protein